MLTSIPAALYRGGTSKGPLILADDLPHAPSAELDAVLLAIMGSPHPRQVDGIGGADSLTSKVAVVSRSTRDDADVDYLFAQVTPNSTIVDYASNCGNMLSAVGPFALERGLVAASPRTTNLRIYNINTESVIETELQTPDETVAYEGDAAIDGVPGAAAPVRLNFARTVGSKTGSLFPTGLLREPIAGIDTTLIDIAVPLVVIAAEDLGKTGHESKAELDADTEFIAQLDKIRNEAGLRMGMGDTSALVVPKPIVVSRPGQDGGITSRDFVPYACHATHSVTGAIALSVASTIPGTVAFDVAAPSISTPRNVRIEHPSGVIAIDVETTGHDAEWQIHQATLVRTCRKLFDGNVYIPSSVWTR